MTVSFVDQAWAAAVPTMVVDKPLRSGQRVYAAGGDLVAAPGASPDDGLFDVIRWGDLGRAAVLKAVAGQRNGGEGGGDGKWQSHFGYSGLTCHQRQAMTKLFPCRSG